MKDIVNVPLWFLLCLFILSILFSAIELNVKTEPARFGIVAICATLGNTLGYYKIFLPCYIDSALVALPFFYFGYMLKKTPLLVRNSYDKFNVIVAIICIAISYAIYYWLDQPIIGIRDNYFTGNIVLCYLNALLFVYGVLMLCKTVKWLPIVSYFGRYSIMVLCTHYLLILNIGDIANGKFNLGISDWTVYVLTLIICWLLIPIMRRYFPHVTAQADLINIQSAYKSPRESQL